MALANRLLSKSLVEIRFEEEEGARGEDGGVSADY
jgi:hypothetical protein